MDDGRLDQMIKMIQKNLLQINMVANLDPKECMAYVGQDLDGGGDDFNDRCGF